MSGVLAGVVLLLVAAIVSRWSPLAGGIVIMLPVKLIAYAVTLWLGGDKAAMHAGAYGMLLGVCTITLPSAIILWLWTGWE